MNISNAGIDLIKRFEGLRLKAYLCPAGVWTIGYGTTKGVKAGQRITEAQAEELLRADVEKFELAVIRTVKAPLTQNQLDALVSLAYNIGNKAFGNSTLLRLLNAGDYAGAAKQFDRWTRGGGKVLPGLVKRRAAERALFEDKT